MVCDHINKNQCFTAQPIGPSGLCVAFKNNTIHRGGYPENGYVRYALIIFYPALSPLNTAPGAQKGFEKTTPFPNNPAF